MDPPELRVVIADDSALIREGIARLIEESGGTVVAKVDDGDAFVAAIVEHRPDVSVVDVRMPPTQRDEGLRAAIEARRRVPATPILVLSQYVERQYATELLAGGGGGVGYLLKDRVGDIPEFMDALRRVARGGTAFDPEVVAQLMVRSRPDDPLAALTPREREVLAAMAEGRTNMGIAKLLTITEGATEKHISNIFGKLDLPQSEDDHRFPVICDRPVRALRPLCVRCSTTPSPVPGVFGGRDNPSRSVGSAGSVGHQGPASGGIGSMSSTTSALRHQ